MENHKNPVDKKIFLKFGKTLKQMRLEKQLTQEKLSDLAGIHRTHVAGIEGVHRNPSLKNVVRLANALGVKTKELFNKLYTRLS
ncbi:hypothetical protein A2963_00350 [Candidatus Roizmanbacteria bacterium RIFCSPLOWO2_01_FULL_40_13]|nr:MAG: hypothetical protein A2963_00350 [Candidatus Roizmanbacteria bacterium RIFCSPLOWO2_01_FULL_40_13]